MELLGVWTLCIVRREHNVSETGSVSVFRFPDPISETLCFLVFRITDDGQSPETQ
jgi:hypothetical protein